MSEWVTYVAMGMLGVLLASVFWIGYGVFRMQELLSRCEEEKDVLRREVVTATKMVAKTEMQARTFGAVPVSKLIGDTE